MHRLLLGELGLKGKQVSFWVRAASRFRPALEQSVHLLDNDPHIKSVAERHFVRAPIDGRFVADDARRFCRDDPRTVRCHRR
jgi:hypothetical protein